MEGEREREREHKRLIMMFERKRGILHARMSIRTEYNRTDIHVLDWKICARFNP